MANIEIRLLTGICPNLVFFVIGCNDALVYVTFKAY